MSKDAIYYVPTINRVPSLYRLIQAFGEEKGAKVRRILKGKFNLLSLPSVETADVRTNGIPDRFTLACVALNDVLNGYGVEYAASRGEIMEPNGLTYVNMGDAHDTTMAYDHKTGRWLCTSWGAIVEANPKRFA